jgi:hypothetical protein
MLFLLAVAAVLLLAYWWRNYGRIPDKFPAGPFGLPFFGHLPILMAQDFVTGIEEVRFLFACGQIPGNTGDKIRCGSCKFLLKDARDGRRTIDRFLPDHV